MAKKASQIQGECGGKCGDCGRYDTDNGQCRLMAEASNELCLVKTSPDSPCPINQFVAASSDDLALELPVELIGLRKFAELVGVKLASIQDAIDAGRITAVVQTAQGRKLRKDEALAEWQACHAEAPGAPVDFLEVAMDPEEDPDDIEDVGRVKWGVYKTKQDALLARERRLLIARERQELEGKLHHSDDVAAVWTEILSNVRTRLLAIPSKAAPVVVAKIGKGKPAVVQDLLDLFVREALTELSEYDSETIAARRRLRTGKS